MAKPKEIIKRDLLKAYMQEVNDNFSKSVPKIKNAISGIIFNAVYSSPELQSIRVGKLKLDFGIMEDPGFEIASAVSRSISIKYDRFKYRDGNIEGGLYVNIQPQNHLNLLDLPSSVTLTEKGAILHWLDWLLNYGDSIIILNFGVKYTNGGRSGGAIMSPTTRPFRVDPIYSGTVEDNFITRALNRSYSEIEKKIWQTILT